jgi:putative endonuclease
MTYWVYILASKPGGTLYVGVTNNLIRRVYEHREGLAESFTKRHGVKMLVYFEAHETIEAALQREKKHQALVSRMEKRSDRCRQSQLARPL